jgi:uncharacterized membrane-anchored protein YhcB (DUF1043 family)
MFFFPPNCPPEILEKVMIAQNTNLKIQKEREERNKDLKKMNEYKNAIDKFHENINNSFSMSAMMYFSHIFIEYRKLKKKLDMEDNEWDIL